MPTERAGPFTTQWFAAYWSADSSSASIRANAGWQSGPGPEKLPIGGGGGGTAEAGATGTKSAARSRKRRYNCFTYPHRHAELGSASMNTAFEANVQSNYSSPVG